MGLAQTRGRFAGDAVDVGACVESGLEGTAGGSAGTVAMDVGLAVAGTVGVAKPAGDVGTSGASRLR